MSDSVKKYNEMIEDGYVPTKPRPFIPKTLDEHIKESKDSDN